MTLASKEKQRRRQKVLKEIDRWINLCPCLRKDPSFAVNESCLKHFSFHFASGAASLRSGFEGILEERPQGLQRRSGTFSAISIEAVLLQPRQPGNAHNANPKAGSWGPVNTHDPLATPSSPLVKAQTQWAPGCQRVKGQCPSCSIWRASFRTYTGCFSDLLT